MDSRGKLNVQGKGPAMKAEPSLSRGYGMRPSESDIVEKEDITGCRPVSVGTGAIVTENAPALVSSGAKPFIDIDPKSLRSTPSS